MAVAKKKSKGKYLLIGGTLFVLGVGGWVAYKKYIGKNLDVTLANLDDIDFALEGITGSFTVIITNPTSGTLRVQYPYIRYHLNDKFLGNSTPKDELIKLDPHASIEIPIELSLKSLQALTVLPEIIGLITDGGSATMKIEVKTGIELTDLPAFIFEIPLKK